MLWIILVCLNCDVEPARAAGWRAEVVDASWRRADERSFASRRECLRAIRRANPERDWFVSGDFGQITKITHEPDYVERFSAIPNVQNGAENIGCFSVEPARS